MRLKMNVNLLAMRTSQLMKNEQNVIIQMGSSNMCSG